MSLNPPLLTEFSRRAMATDFVLMLPGMNGKYAEIAVQALAEVDQLEAMLSIYRPDSDISRLNRAAGSGPIGVSLETFQILARAAEISEQTGGAFDVTAGPLVEAWGFTKRQGAKPSKEIIDQAKQRVGFDKLILDPNKCTAELAHPGMSVNLGAIGKGFALDQIAYKLESAGVTDFLIHGGKSSVLVRGDDDSGSEQGWKIAIEHPVCPGKRLGGLRLRNESLGTSGSGKQFFHHQGKRLGHIIDPRTGWPSGDLLSLTVVSPSAMDADALATALFVMGSEEAIAFANRSPSLSQSEAGTMSTARLTEPSCWKPAVGVVAVLPTGQQAEVRVRRANLGTQVWLDE